jgi:ABC-2 type transport system ATP-binding protein
MPGIAASQFSPRRRSTLIRIDNVTKMYGPTVAVDNISFTVEKGDVLGFLGPNGAGKTTTMRVLTGYFPPTDGNAFVEGFSIIDKPLEVKRRIGYVPETPAMYGDMRVTDYLGFIGAIKGVPRGEIGGNVDRVVERCALKEMAKKNIGQLSRGYRQRVALAQALVNDPPVLVLDEPTSGLDPKQIYEIRSLIKSMEGERTIILSTHILPEVSMTCNKVVIINEGVIVAEGDTSDLGRRFSESHQIEVKVKGSTAEAKKAVSAVGGVRSIDVSGDTLIVDSGKEKDVRADIARAVVGAGLGLLELRSRDLSLEDVFLRLVTEEGVKK